MDVMWCALRTWLGLRTRMSLKMPIFTVFTSVLSQVWRWQPLQTLLSVPNHPSLFFSTISAGNICKSSKSSALFSVQLSSRVKQRCDEAPAVIMVLFFCCCSEGSSCKCGTFCLLLWFEQRVQVVLAQRSVNMNRFKSYAHIPLLQDGGNLCIPVLPSTTLTLYL